MGWWGQGETAPPPARAAAPLLAGLHHVRPAPVAITVVPTRLRQALPRCRAVLAAAARAAHGVGGEVVVIVVGAPVRVTIIIRAGVVIRVNVNCAIIRVDAHRGRGLRSKRDRHRRGGPVLPHAAAAQCGTLGVRRTGCGGVGWVRGAEGRAEAWRTCSHPESPQHTKSSSRLVDRVHRREPVHSASEAQAPVSTTSHIAMK